MSFNSIPPFTRCGTRHLKLSAWWSQSQVAGRVTAAVLVSTATLWSSRLPGPPYSPGSAPPSPQAHCGCQVAHTPLRLPVLGLCFSDRDYEVEEWQVPSGLGFTFPGATAPRMSLAMSPGPRPTPAPALSRPLPLPHIAFIQPCLLGPPLATGNLSDFNFPGPVLRLFQVSLRQALASSHHKPFVYSWL